MVKPPVLKVGDRVRVVAPSSNIGGLSPEVVKRGLSNLEGLGLQVELDEGCWRDHHGAAGTPLERAATLMDAFQDPAVKGILCLWRGYNCNDLLPYLDWDIPRQTPKFLCGYSDITVLNTALLTASGLVTFQGPSFVNFTRSYLLEWEIAEFTQIAMGRPPHSITPAPAYIDDPFHWQHPEEKPPLVDNPGWRVVREGEAEGRLLGGHLGSLLTLAGTPFWPDTRGCLLFLETDEESHPKQLRRELSHLHQLGALDNPAGLMFGRIPAHTGIKGPHSVENLASDLLEGVDYPVVAGVDLGHTSPSAALPMGVRARLSTTPPRLTLLEPWNM